MTSALAPALRRRLKGVIPGLRALASPYPPGHYHSPLPDLAEVRAREADIFAMPSELPGIDLRPAAQLELLAEFAKFSAELPWGPAQETGLRYRLDNGWFAHGDGVALYGMLRNFRPKRYVEVGSGWSSAAVLDVNDIFLGHDLEFTFIEPNPERLHSLLRPKDVDRVELVSRPVHQASPEIFGRLEAGDILFIDSSHVSRIGSDVNYLFLEVIPSLPAGVHVHVHDIFYPFEYPREWVYRGRAWNENYLLRACLMNNDSLQITWFNSYLGAFHRAQVAAVLPSWGVDPGGSIWLQTRNQDNREQ